MTEILSTTRSHDRPWQPIPDSVERILLDMEAHTLDPTFEDFGDFVDRSPEWEAKDTAKKYAGCTVIWGNFYDYSGVFEVITDDQTLIGRFTDAVARNKLKPEYKAAKLEIERRRREEKESMIKDQEQRIELSRIIYGH